MVTAMTNGSGFSTDRCEIDAIQGLTLPELRLLSSVPASRLLQALTAVNGTLSPSAESLGGCPFMGGRPAVPMAGAVGGEMIAPRPTRVETRRLALGFSRRRLDPQRARRHRDHRPRRRVRRCGPPHSGRATTHGGWFASDAWSYRTAAHASAFISS